MIVNPIDFTSRLYSDRRRNDERYRFVRIRGTKLCVCVWSTIAALNDAIGSFSARFFFPSPYIYIDGQSLARRYCNFFVFGASGAILLMYI